MTQVQQERPDFLKIKIKKSQNVELSYGFPLPITKCRPTQVYVGIRRDYPKGRGIREDTNGTLRLKRHCTLVLNWVGLRNRRTAVA